MFKKGFSLLEILIVVFLITVFSLLTLSGIRSYKLKLDLRLQQQLLDSDLALIKEEARSLLSDMVIYFKNDIYEVYRNADLYKKSELQAGFAAEYARIGFTKNGSTKYAGTVRFSYKNQPRTKLVLAPGVGQWRWENL